MGLKKTEQVNSTLLDLSKISRGSTFTGDIQSDGDFRIDGTLQGNITTAGRVVVGEGGTVTGQMKCHDAEVEGTVNGEIVAEDMLSIKSTGVVTGSIKSARLAVELGARLDVTSCQMHKQSEEK